MTEERIEKQPLAEGDSIKRKEVTGIKTEQKTETTEVKYTEQSMDKKPPDKEKKGTKTENASKVVECTEQRIDVNWGNEAEIPEKRVEKLPLLKDDDIKKEKVTEKTIEQRIEADEDDPFLFCYDTFTEECREKTTKHHRKKRKREDEGNRHKIKHRMKTYDSDKRSRKKRRHHSREDDSESEIEEGEIPKRKMKKHHSPSPTHNYHEGDQIEIKKEIDDSMQPSPSIEQELPLVQGMYHCDICNIALNSDITYQSHIAGKKHKKNLNAKKVAEADAKPDLNSKCQTIVEFAELFKSYSHPDPSKAGFYCKICNSHSNSSSMWEAHIIGKRHIANLKKAPGAGPSKSRNVPAPRGTVARLKSQLKHVNEPIVGLDQIREIQRLDCDFVSYTCFLCGGIAVSEEEIVDHILLTKHREKYLEKIECLEFETIRHCQMSVRDTLVAKLCERIEAERGRGKPEVYYDKNSLVKMENKLL